MRALRLGVDVGGTFTDVVAIDARTRTLVARVKVPTTHGSPGGVADGIIAGIEQLLREHAIEPQDVAFIAHSTTQATNALLEGDVAAVGVLGLLPRAGWLARAQIRFPALELAPQRNFAPMFAFARADDGAAIDRAIDLFVHGGVQALAVSQPFSVDRPQAERGAVAAARERGLAATGGSDVTAMYGLRARTRTAAINAAILPTMLRTAQVTRSAVERARIAAPLMVMRSDGGVMNVEEMASRPILTMLSGPAAGVAGALLYENVTDGIFLEVGGTSVDCSAIRAGRPQMRPARVGGHRTMLHTIDSRTLGVAGGSMPRADAHRIVGVGPRSAHIAGCRYASFCTPAQLEGAQLERFAPRPGDPADYLRLRLRDGDYATVTPTCASNLLGYVPSDAFARGNADAALAAFSCIAAALGADARAHARAMLDLAVEKIRGCIEGLIADYELPADRVVLIGGGGGAAALVPYLGEALRFEHRIAKDAEVISPIGVALALVRDVVERTIVDPQPDDIVRIRREAFDRAVAAGAAPDRIELSVEIDTQHSRVRATASGATAMSEDAARDVRSEAEQRSAAAKNLRCAQDELHESAATSALRIYTRGNACAIVDARAVVRLILENAAITVATIDAFESTLAAELESHTTFGDVGRTLPDLYLVQTARITDLRGLASAPAIIALAKEEITGLPPTTPIILITAPHQ